MSVLHNVLETIPGVDCQLEAFDRSGSCARRLTSGEFVRAIRAFRTRLRRERLDACTMHGRPVLALLFRPEETIEFLVAAFAAMGERFSIVPLFPNWPPETQRQYLEAYGIRGLLTGAGFAERASEWSGDCLDRTMAVDLDALLADSEAYSETAEAFPLEIGAEHPCAYIFTSGTSGKLAKLTEITRGNLDAAVENIRDLEFLYPGMTLHSPLSTSHIFAFVVVLGFLALKPKRLLFSDIQYLTRLSQERTGKVEGLILVPIVLNRIRAGFYEKLVSRKPDDRALARIPLRLRRRLKRVLARAEDAVLGLEAGGRIAKRDWLALRLARKAIGRKIRQRLGSPDFVVVGGAKPNLRAMAFLEVMGMRCLQGWGMTETTGPLAVCRPHDRYCGAFGTCGRLFSDTTAEIASGELIVGGPQIARGYLEPTGEFVAFDGKKPTGDYAEFDDVGRLKILGKASDRITTENGLNYNPIPIEERLLAVDLEREHRLEEVVVIGDGQPRLGAVFFLRAAVLEDRDSNDRYLREILGAYNCDCAVDERLEAWDTSPVVFKDAGFLGPSGKLVRRRVEESYASVFPQPVATR